MPALLLTLLKLIFLAFIYLFVWQIARAVHSHLGGGDLKLRSRRTDEVVIVKSSTQAGTTIDPRTPVVLGRSPQADIVLDDPYASEFHFRMVRRPEGIVVNDLGSTNGTYVNGRRIAAPVTLSKGDTIQVGNTVMEVR